MRIFCLVVFVCALIGCSGTSDDEVKTADQTDVTSVLNGAELTELVVNVSYSAVTQLNARPSDHKIPYGDNEFQFAELWLPTRSNDSQRSPMVIFIHGGCWLNAFDIQHTYALSTELANRGIAVFSLEYRRTGDPGGGWPGSFEDVIAGVNTALNLRNYPINMNKVVLSGHSAGGHLALLAGAELAPEQIKGVIGLAAIVDIFEYSRGSNSCQTAAKPFMGGDEFERAEQYHLANPAGRELHPFSVLLQGTADTIVPQTQAILSGTPYVLEQEAGHFDWIHTQSAAFFTFLDTFQNMVER